jgi:hypothetical protein
MAFNPYRVGIYVRSHSPGEGGLDQDGLRRAP